MKAAALTAALALLAVPLALADPAPNAQPYVSQVLSTRQAKLGEPFKLDVTVTHEPSQHWDLVVPDSLGAFSLLQRTTSTRHEGNQEIDHLTLELGLYEPGKHLIPALSLKERTTGAVVPLPQDAEVEATSTLVAKEPHTLRDVAGPRPVYFRDPRKIAAGLAALLALGALLVFAARAARRAWRRLFPPETEEQRDRRLLGQLAALEDEPFFDALDGILRRGLARWHGVAAVEHTAEEIVGALSARPPEGVPIDELASVLRESVRVRFAHRSTSPERRETALSVCQRIFPPLRAKGISHARPALS